MPSMQSTFRLLLTYPLATPSAEIHGLLPAQTTAAGEADAAAHLMVGEPGGTMIAAEASDASWPRTERCDVMGVLTGVRLSAFSFLKESDDCGSSAQNCQMFRTSCKAGVSNMGRHELASVASRLLATRSIESDDSGKGGV